MVMHFHEGGVGAWFGWVGFGMDVFSPEDKGGVCIG